MKRMRVSSSILTGTALAIGLAVSSPAAEKVNFEDHVLPILRNNCLKCHNPDKNKGELDLTSFGGAVKGGGSGISVNAGDPDGSKLLKVITHADEPTMPPNSPKLPDAEIEIIKQWILGGLLEKSGSKALASAKPKVDLSVNVSSVGKPEGPPPMPGDLLIENFVVTPRRSVSIAMANSPWAPVVALGGQHQVLLYHTDTLELLGILPYPEGYPSDIKFSRNGKLVAVGGGRGSKAGQVAVYDISNGERVTTVGDEFDTVLAADISADQKLVALGSPGRLVKIFSTKDGELLHKMKKHTEWVTSVEFSPNGKYLATGDRNGGVMVWEAANGQEVYTLAGHKGAITSLSWRSDSDTLVSASEDGSVRLWKMADGQQVRNWTAHNGGTLSARVTHDGRIVTTGRDNQVAIWDAAGSKQRGIAMTNDIPVRATFSHDGKRVVASDWAGNVLVWNSADGKLVGSLELNPLPLPERIAQGNKRISELQQGIAEVPVKLVAAETEAAQAKTDLDKADKKAANYKDLAKRLETANARVAELKAQPDQLKPELERTKSAVARYEAARAYTSVYKAKNDFASHQAESERLTAEAASAKEAAEKAAHDLAEAKKATAKTKEEKAALAVKLKKLTDQSKAASVKATSAKVAAEKAVKDLASEKSRVERLVSEFERNKPASNKPVKSAAL
jgi:predicted  nucleic acid-binding Zn-ribbon protein